MLLLKERRNGGRGEGCICNDANRGRSEAEKVHIDLN